MKVAKLKTANGYVYIEFEEFGMFCYHLSPNVPLGSYEDFDHGSIFNAKITLRSFPISDEREKTPIFVRGASESFIHVNMSLQGQVNNCNMMDSENISLHG